MKLFVFDLDFTLWNAGDTWCDCTTPPYKWSNGHLLDRYGRWIRLFEEVPEILRFLKNEDRLIAAASRTEAPDWANELLQLLGVNHYFDAKEIYPGDKFRHLRSILRRLKINPNEVVFFDDEYRNIQDVQSMGITSVYVKNGLTRELIRPFV